jgi:hypothetical protein
MATSSVRAVLFFLVLTALLAERVLALAEAQHSGGGK